MTATAAVPAASVGSRAAWTRLGAVGLTLAALGPVIFIVASLASGTGGDDLGFFVVATAVALAGAAALWWLRTAGKIVGIVASLLVGAALFWTAFGLGFPASVVDFVPGIAVPLGVLMGLGGSIASIVAKRRGSFGQSAAEQRIVTGALSLVVVAALVSAVLTFVGRDVVAAPAGAVTSTMSEFTFTEGTYEVTAGEPVTIAIHNADPVVHDFAIPALGIEPVTVGPGSDALIELDAEPGSYTIYCTLHSDSSIEQPDEAGMAATLVAR